MGGGEAMSDGEIITITSDEILALAAGGAALETLAKEFPPDKAAALRADREHLRALAHKLLQAARNPHIVRFLP